nr:MAG TPA: hypothetical protein [Caudoviricetes sp.]
MPLFWSNLIIYLLEFIHCSFAYIIYSVSKVFWQRFLSKICSSISSS